MNLKSIIIEKAKELNIDIIGFTDGNPLVNIEDYLIYRRDNNIQIEFEERDIERRINPKLTLPDCKSIIVIGISYNVDYSEKPDYKYKGVLSKSTWGLDYHRVLKKKIIDLVEEIKRIKEFNYQYFVDTGPLVERELARKAGIGYFGKNCSIINEEYGSFIFLGYIMTDLEIQANENPIGSKCGDCDLCIKACPTNALEPYKLNSRKCISYLTQTKDIIPVELRKKMNNKIYGCDTCQLVCPKNKGVKLSEHKEFIPEMTKGYMDIEEILKISNKEFKLKYGNMAGAWRGKNILRRNGIIALGNMKSDNLIFHLQEIIEKDNETMAEYAQWALENILSKD